MTTIVVKMSEPTGMKMAHADLRIPKLKEYILVYTNGERSQLGNINIPKEKWDNEYKTLLENISRDEVEIIKKIRENEDRTLEDIKNAIKFFQKLSTFLWEQHIRNMKFLITNMKILTFKMHGE